MIFPVGSPSFTQGSECRPGSLRCPTVKLGLETGDPFYVVVLALLGPRLVVGTK